MSESFKGAQSVGHDLVGQAKTNLLKNEMPLEGMGQEAKITEESVSDQNISKALKDSSAGQWVLEQEKRPDKVKVTIDPQHDPLMKASTEVVKDPLAVLKARETVVEDEGKEKDQEFTCEEPSDPFEMTCAQNLVVDVKVPPLETYIVTAQVAVMLSWGSASKVSDFQGGGRNGFLKLWDGAGLYRDTYDYKLETDPQIYPLSSYQSLPTHRKKNVEFKDGGFRFTELVWRKHYRYIPLGSAKGEPCYAYVSPDISDKVKGVDPEDIQVRCLSSSQFETKYFFNKKTGLFSLRPKKYHCNETLTDTLVFEVSFKRKPEVVEKWENACAALEALSSDEGKAPCDLIEERCTQGPETRVINGLPVHRPCWKKVRTYLCGNTPYTSTCGEYRIRGCSQVGSECASKIGSNCVLWKQRYRCPKGGKRTRRTLKGDDVPWCLDGNCYTPSWEANTDMLNALSKMAVLQQIQKDMNDLSIFKGQGLECRRGCLDFQNCCGTSRGWGISLRFASCSDEEKLLSQKQGKGLCVFLGTYCAKRVFGVCVQKRSRSCCFESRIARIIQVAAHQQLGLSWGSPEHPQCRGITPEELAKLDLEKVDFSELYEEIMARYKAPTLITPQKDALTKTVKGVSKGDPVAGKEGL